MKEHAAPELAGFSTDDWLSPPLVLDPAHDFIGGRFGIDPATNENSLVHAITTYTEMALGLPWYHPRQKNNHSAWMNEPYSKSAGFTDKANHEMQAERVDEMIRLTMGAPSTAWWRRSCLKSPRNPRIIFTKRISFLGPKRQKMSTCRFEPALLYYGPRPEKFERAFHHIASWTRWGR